MCLTFPQPGALYLCSFHNIVSIYYVALKQIILLMNIKYMEYQIMLITCFKSLKEKSILDLYDHIFQHITLTTTNCPQLLII